MKRFLSVLICIFLVLTTLWGCDEKSPLSDEKTHTEHKGVYLTLSSVSEDSIEVVWHNETAREAVYGEYYYVERYNEQTKEWESALAEDFFVNDIALLLDAHSERKKAYSLEYFDLSKDGKYRLRAEFFFGDGNTYNTWVEFYTYINFLHNDYGGWGLSRKTVVDCGIAYEIIDGLGRLNETGVTVPKISEKPLEVAVRDDSVKGGILWLEIGDKIYRIDPKTREICLVEKHLGKGAVLDAPDELITLIYTAWQYHPYDYYIGSYNVAIDRLEVKNVYRAASSVGITVKKIEIKDSEDFVEENTITLELVSDTDQTLYLELDSQQSSDNFATMKSMELSLKAEEPQTVEINFAGWSSLNYYLSIRADNTRIRLHID